MTDRTTVGSSKAMTTMAISRVFEDKLNFGHLRIIESIHGNLNNADAGSVKNCLGKAETTRRHGDAAMGTIKMSISISPARRVASSRVAFPSSGALAYHAAGNVLSGGKQWNQRESRISNRG